VIKDAVDTIGQQIRVRNYKNKTSVPFRDAELNLYYKGGFRPEEEYLDFLIKFGIFKQGGAWYSNEEYGLKLNGRTKIQEWLDAHPDEFNLMKIKVDEELLHANELDANNKDPELENSEEEISEEILED
jgi:recombination protein RecA